MNLFLWQPGEVLYHGQLEGKIQAAFFFLPQIDGKEVKTFKALKGGFCSFLAMSLLSWALCARRICQTPQHGTGKFYLCLESSRTPFLTWMGFVKTMNGQLDKENTRFYLKINYLWVEPIIILQHFFFSALFGQKYFCGPNDCLFQQGKAESCCPLHSPAISSPLSWVAPVLDPELKWTCQISTALEGQNKQTKPF